MRYSRLSWTHSSPSEPVEILSEYDHEGWERRKVELFADGSLRFAGEAGSSGGSRLSLIRCPADRDVIKEGEFQVFELTKDEFERAWEQAHQVGVETGRR